MVYIDLFIKKDAKLGCSLDDTKVNCTPRNEEPGESKGKNIFISYTCVNWQHSSRCLIVLARILTYSIRK